MIPIIPFLCFPPFEWGALVTWLTNVSKSIPHFSLPNASVIYLKKKDNGFIEIIHKLYYKEDNHWMVQTNFRPILITALPDWLLNKVGDLDEEVDVTKEIENKLGLKFNKE